MWGSSWEIWVDPSRGHHVGRVGARRGVDRYGRGAHCRQKGTWSSEM